MFLIRLVIICSMKVSINSAEFETFFNSLILECCFEAGTDLPKFCYHSELFVAGNCRMCLVEVEKLPKLVTACAVPVGPEMAILTNTFFVQKSRESALELLLINHPLDCPICDQGGECDLQEQVSSLCSDKGRFFVKKRPIEDKNCGPLIKTVMTRCIHCTRCVRFISEVTDINDICLGTSNRGIKTEISTFVENIVQNEFSGNLIDLCPVGALTSKPYIFSGRPWESKVVESIDIFDSLGTSIKIEYKELDIIRVLPKFSKNSNLNQWISDKVRFSYDGLYRNRLTEFIKFDRSDSTYQSISWYYIINDIEHLLSITDPSKICFIIGTNNDLETSWASKSLAQNLGVLKVSNDSFSFVDATYQSNYTFDLKILDNADCFLLVSTNPRLEASLVNLQIESKIKKNAAVCGVVGAPFKSDYNTHQFLGLTLKTLFQILEGKHPFSRNLKNAKAPILFCGSGLFERRDSRRLLNAIRHVNAKIKIFDKKSINLLLRNSNDVGHLNLRISSFFPEILNNVEVIYLIHPNQRFLDYLSNYLYLRFLHSGNFPYIIYQGSHIPLNYIDIIDYFLPGKTFAEKEGSFFNIQNICQTTSKVFENINDTRAIDDHVIILLLKFFFAENSNVLLSDLIPSLKYFEADYDSLIFDSSNLFSKVKVYNTLLKPIIEDYYLTHEISKNSATMSQCSINVRKYSKNFLVFKK